MLKTASKIYGAAIGMRNWLYDKNLLPASQPPCRVVCIGNLTTGGTGKTTLVQTLSRELTVRRVPHTIVLRGYKRRGSGVRVVSDGERLRIPWQESGDEAALLARKGKIPVVVGEDRVAAARLAYRLFSPRIILLDDGFGHRALRRDCDILLLDGTSSKNGLLPFGHFREPFSSIQRAHLLVMTHTEENERHFEIDFYGKPIFHAHLAAKSKLKGMRAIGFCGVGNPEHFRLTLLRGGARLLGFHMFPDHHSYSKEDLDFLIAEAGRLRARLVTTAKDAVKLPRDFPVNVVRVSWRIEEGMDRLMSFVAGS